MRLPRVSFVIPAYNAQKYLTDAVYSCLNQSMKQAEVIVVNDGSTDGTRELLEWIAKKEDRVVAINLEENVGRSEARNIGNKAARAEYICVLDADDMCTKTRMRDTITTFELKNVDVVYGPFYEINELGAVLRKVKAGPFNKELAIKQKLNFICHSTMAYRKSVAEAIRYDTGIFSDIGCDDWKFQWDAYLKGFRFGVTKGPLAYYRLCQGTISTKRDPDQVRKVKDEFLANV